MKIIKDLNPLVYIYCIENTTNNKRYIGQTTSYTMRSKQHLIALVKNSHYNLELQEDYNKGDNLICSIIEKCDYDLRYTKENFWINHYKSMENGYNKTVGAKFGVKKKNTELQKKALQDFHKSRKGLYRKTRVVDVTCLNSGKVYSFKNLVEAGKFFNVKGHTLSKAFKNNLIINYKGFYLKREA